MKTVNTTMAALALAALALAACSKENEAGQGSSSDGIQRYPVSFEAVGEGGGVKTTLGESRSVVWTAGDAISLLYVSDGATANDKLTTTAGGAASATFSGDAGTATDGVYYAVYPYADGTSLSDGVLSYTVSNGTQAIGAAGSFGSGYNVSVAKTSGSSLYFRNLNALVKFTIPEELDNIKRIDFFPNGASESFRGTYSVTPSEDGEPVISFAPNTDARNVGVEYGDGSACFPAGTYYFTCPPVSLAYGFRAKVLYSDDSIQFDISGTPLTLVRNKVYNIGTFAYKDSFVYDDFEDTEVIYGQTSLTTAAGSYGGNSGALSIVANPYGGEGMSNTSGKVLRDDMSSSSNSTSGYVTLTLSQSRLPGNARSNFKGMRVKVYLGSAAYYPYFQFGSTKCLPSKVNGTSISSADDYAALTLKSNDWNVFEVTFPSGFSLGNNNQVQLRPFSKSDGSSIAAGAASDTNPRVCWIDDWEFTW